LHWDEAYKGTPPWDVGHPQPVFEALVEAGEIEPGRALDIGCGRGENAIMLAMNGFNVTGIDLVKDAIADAKTKAIERRVEVNFVVGDVLQMDRLFAEGEFDVVIDSGLFHAMTDEERPVFARQVHRMLKTGGKYFMLCFSDKEPPGQGPRRVSKYEIEHTFTPLFKIIYIKDSAFESRFGMGRKEAYLLSAMKQRLENLQEIWRSQKQELRPQNL
jgi:cyclopropane fatty-acyl-phospholipid synthase-like methyltransferase